MCVCPDFVAHMVITVEVVVDLIRCLFSGVKQFVDVGRRDVEPASRTLIELFTGLDTFLVHPFGVSDRSAGARMIDHSRAHSRMLVCSLSLATIPHDRDMTFVVSLS